MAASALVQLKESRDAASSGEVQESDDYLTSFDDFDDNDNDYAFGGGLFDMRMRGHMIPMGGLSWVTQAKAVASQVRSGARTHEMWWSNQKVAQRYPVESLRLSMRTGVCAFKIRKDVCQAMEGFLIDPANYTDDGFLIMAGTQWPGYGSYPYVHAALGLMPSVQERKTVRVHGKSKVDHILRGDARVRALVAVITDVLNLPLPVGRQAQPNGKNIKAMHFLRQDMTQQAVFTWHDDTEDLGTNGHKEHMTTVILNLSDNLSAMRVWGCEPSFYQEQGDCVAFPGAALHETVPRTDHAVLDQPVYKVAFFYA